MIGIGIGTRLYIYIYIGIVSMLDDDLGIFGDETVFSSFFLF